MTPLTINGERLQCPGCYEELPTGTYQRIIKEWDPDQPDLSRRDYFKLFSILTGTNYTIRRTAENEDTIWNAVKWYILQPFQFETSLPKVLEVSGKKISVPKNTGSLGIGQNIKLKQIIATSRFMEENIAMAVAICLQPLHDQADFDFDRAVELSKVIEDMPIYLTHPVGFFLLQTVRRDGWRSTKTWRRHPGSLRQILKAMWPRWRASRRSKSLTTYRS